MGTIDNFTPMQGKELPSRGRMLIKKDDVVMSSLNGSLSKIALITSDDKNIIGSTGFFVLRKKEYEPEVALVLLKSKPIQTLLGRQGQGTILSAIPKSSLSRVVLPKPNPTIQKKIKELVLTAHKEKEEAKALLEKAKRAVEIFVEKDEKEAMDFLVTPLVQ
jgi:restriction endonuclease S subunit